MSFLDITPTQQTGIQINSWINSCESNMISAKSTFETIKNWLATSVDNPDYSEEDRQEVIARLGELRILAISLTE
jgi:hypothetical protein